MGRGRKRTFDLNHALDLWSDDVPGDEIASRLGIRIGCLHRAISVARANGDARAKSRAYVSPDYFTRKATSMGITRGQLIRRILSTIAQDDMVKAILDD